MGISEVTLGGEITGTLIEPIYNMEPPGGDIVARFGLFAGLYPTLINIRVDPVNYSLIASVEGASAAAGLIGAATTFWGVPAAPAHDRLRLTPEEALNLELPDGGRDSGQPEVPFLSNPSDCSLQRAITMTAVSYQLPDEPRTMSAPYPGLSAARNLSSNRSSPSPPPTPKPSPPPASTRPW